TRCTHVGRDLGALASGDQTGPAAALGLGRLQEDVDLGEAHLAESRLDARELRDRSKARRRDAALLEELVVARLVGGDAQHVRLARRDDADADRLELVEPSRRADRLFLAERVVRVDPLLAADLED